MKALWLLPTYPKFERRQNGEISNLELSLETTHIASMRMRTAVAVSACCNAGGENVFRSFSRPELSSIADFIDTDVCIVTKYLDGCDLDYSIETCKLAKKAGARLITDISDFPFMKSTEVQTFYNEILGICDEIVANSNYMASLMAETSARDCRVIEDAILTPPRQPKFAPSKTLELLWFGHPSNLPYIENLLGALVDFSHRKQSRLTIVTEDRGGLENSVHHLNNQLPKHFRLRFVPWSIEQNKIALRKCDLVLIPGDPSDRRKAGVSSNRLAESLNAGRFPIASPIDSYLPYSDCAFLGDNLIDGITWVLSHRNEVYSKIKRGQLLVAQRVGVEKIARDWIDLLFPTRENKAT